jgi:hypothetical protein
MSKTLNRLPKVIRDAVKDIKDPALSPKSRLANQLKVISLARTLTRPRPDQHDQKTRMPSDLEMTMNDPAMLTAI